MTSSPVLAILKLQHEKVRISVKKRLMSKISSYVFHKAMSRRSDFPFNFLQPAGAGSRTLRIPSVSSSFSWTEQVAKLGPNKQSIYILARDKLAVKSEVSVNSVIKRLCIK